MKPEKKKKNERKERKEKSRKPNTSSKLRPQPKLKHPQKKEAFLVFNLRACKSRGSLWDYFNQRNAVCTLQAFG